MPTRWPGPCIDAEAYQLRTYWTATVVLDGGTVGPEASCNKLFWSETDLAIQGPPWACSVPKPNSSKGRRARHGRPRAWLDGFLFALAGPIYAGTNEIQRNVVAERLLGLPRG